MIMFTGRGNENIATEALRLGVTSYIQKDSGVALMELLPSVVLHFDQREPTQAR